MCDLPNAYKGQIIYYCTAYRSTRVHFKISIPYSEERGRYSHEDPRRPKNRNPLREVAVKLLVPRRSLLYSVPQQPIEPLPITSSRLRRRDLRSSDSSFRAALDGLTFSCTASVPALFQKVSESLPIKRCSSSSAAPARITSPQTNARHDPKNGQARR